MSEEKKGFTFRGMLSNLVSSADKAAGKGFTKKTGTALIIGSAGYGVFTGDIVGTVVGIAGGSALRFRDQAEAVAEYADSVVDAILGRKPEPQAHPVKDLAKTAQAYDDAAICVFTSLACSARERQAAGKMKAGDKEIIEAAVSLGL